MNIQYQSGAINAGDCISLAWELYKRNFGLYFGAGLVTLILISCIPFVNFFLIGPMMGGFSYLVLRDMRNEPIDFGMLFKGFDKFVPLMVVGLIQAIPGIVFQVFQYVVDLSTVFGPGVGTGSGDAADILKAGAAGTLMLITFAYLIVQAIWNAALTFAIPLIIEHDAPLGEAITLSLGAVFSNIGGLILLVILNGLIGILGFLMLCIGVFFVMPITFISYNVAYRQVFPYTGGASPMNVAPPPPDSYNFGSGM